MKKTTIASWFKHISFILLLAIPTWSQAAHGNHCTQLGGWRWPLSRMMQYKLIQEVAVSPKGHYIAYVVEYYQKNQDVWRKHQVIKIADAEGRVIHQTSPALSYTHLKWSPNGHYLGFIEGGMSFNVFQHTSSTVKTLMSAKTFLKDYAWSPNSSEIVFIQHNGGDDTGQLLEPIEVGRQYQCDNLYTIELASKSDSIQQLTHYRKSNQCHSITSVDWSPHGNALVYAHQPAGKGATWHDDTITEIRLKNDKKRNLVQQKLVQHEPRYSPNGKFIAFHDGGRVYIVPAKGGQAKPLAKTPDHMLYQFLGWSHDSQAVYVAERVKTETKIFKLTRKGTPTITVSHLHKFMKHMTLNHSGRYFGFTIEDTNEPEEAYWSQLDPFKPVQVSYENQAVSLKHFPKTEVIHWYSADGRKIEGLLTYPLGYQKGRRYPLLVEMHGGPANFFRKRFLGRRSVYPVPVFAAEGYVYLRPNVRGSSGYGVKFRQANFKDWGGYDYQDVKTGIKKVVKMGLADPDRIGVLGWSYGGYLAARTISQDPTIKVATMGGAITDLISYTGTNDLPHFVPNGLGGYFWQHKRLMRRYIAHSPIFDVGAIKTPTLMQYGINDQRVPKTQGYELYRALKLRHVPVRMQVYPQSGHAILQPDLIFQAACTNINWINQWMSR